MTAREILYGLRALGHVPKEIQVAPTNMDSFLLTLEEITFLGVGHTGQLILSLVNPHGFGMDQGCLDQ